MSDYRLAVNVKGPLFTGRVHQIIGQFRDDSERAIADEGVEMVRERLDEVLQNPTGFYRSRITSEPSGTGWATTDSGVVYGPWLEGVGSRNKTTRFKGYATFRRVTGLLQRRSAEIAGQIFRTRFSTRLNR